MLAERRLALLFGWAAFSILAAPVAGTVATPALTVAPGA
jgi:hypothetical protein